MNRMPLYRGTINSIASSGKTSASQWEKKQRMFLLHHIHTRARRAMNEHERTNCVHVVCSRTPYNDDYIMRSAV